jgi:hypothetical protein
MPPLDATTAAAVEKASPSGLFIHEDRPRPGRGYVAANLFLFGALAGTGLALPLLFAYNPGSLLGACLLHLVAVYMLVVLHAAFRTVYTLCGASLEMRCGYWLRGEIDLEDIERIDLIGALPRVAGKGPSGRAFGNRFNAGLRLVTTQGDIYLTPTDPESFAKLLSGHKQMLTRVRKAG